MMVLNQIYKFIFYQPIFNFLSFLTNLFQNFEIAIFFLTLAIKTILFPLDYYSLKTEKKMRKIQKEILNLKNLNQAEKTKKLIEILKKEKLTPFFNFFAFFIQLPILIALYQILKNPNPLSLHFLFFDLSQPNFLFPFLIFVFLIFFALKEKTKNFLVYFSAFLTFFVLLKFPGALSFYIFLSLILTHFERIFFFKKL